MKTIHIKKAVGANNGFRDLLRNLQINAGAQYTTAGKWGNSEKNVKSVLTEKTQGASLKNVPDATNTRHNIKQTNGGNVQNTKPPTMRGFFMPATQPGDCTKLSGVARNKTPPSGNTCSVSIWTLNGSRQLLNCPNIKQTYEANAMQGNNQGIATPVANVQGYHPSLIPSALLQDTIQHAKQQRATTGKANAYAELLNHFHRTILPAFFVECDGNLSEIARLLGIHRESVRKYAALADLTCTTDCNGGAQ